MTMPGSPRGGLSRSQVDATVAAALALNQRAEWEVIDGRLAQATAAMQTDRAYFHEIPAAMSPVALSTVSLYVVATATANVDLAIYSLASGTLTRIATTGTTAVGPAGARQTIALAGGATRQPGTRYYVAVACNSATPTFPRHNAIYVGAFGGRSYQKTGIGVGTLPASTTVASMSDFDQTWWIGGA